MTRAVGIDLGTTHALVAYVNAAGHTEILPHREGNLLVPSVVMFDDTHTFVGEEAKLRGKTHPDRLAACVKLDMGRASYSQSICGLRIPPEVIQACILNKLKQQMDFSLGQDVGVVIAVPAGFNELQRRATTTAGEMAGLNVLGVLNEPVAAVLAFSEHLAYPTAGGAEERLNYLVYDLGGYTFEATLLAVQPWAFTTLATAQDPHLGGHAWDMRLVDYLAEQFIRQHGIDPREHPTSLENLLHRAAKAKIALGVRDATTVTVSHEGKSINVPITRTQFLESTADLLQRTIDMVERLLSEVGLSWQDVPRVILAGGATRMPEIRRVLSQRSGFEPLCFVSPEECVARGAAIYAGNLLAAQQSSVHQPTFSVRNVSTHSLGIQGVDHKGRKVNKILIPRGTPLPAAATEDFVTKTSAQKSITVIVLEGEESDPAKCTTVGRAVLRDLPDDLTEEWPVQVTYAYSADGKISVEARVRYTDRSVHLEVHRAREMSRNQLQRWRRAVQSEQGIAAVKQVLAEEHRERMARSVPDASDASDQPEPSQTGVLSFLRRYMPFAFKHTAKQGESDQADKASADGSSTASNIEQDRSEKPGNDAS